MKKIFIIALINLIIVGIINHFIGWKMVLIYLLGTLIGNYFGYYTIKKGSIEE